MKIKKLRALLPAMLEYEDGGRYYSIFVYIDGDSVIVPDQDFVFSESFREAFAEFMKTQKKPLNIPDAPQDGFKNLDPRDYYDK